jgi:tRNA(fMet)-specific endonuclease VapC
MILLDTDHVTQLHYRSHPSSQALQHRLDKSEDQRIAVTVVTLEEQMRGWLAAIQRGRTVHQQLPAYERLVKLFDFYSAWAIVVLDERAAEQFEHLRKQKIRIGTNDLKIASIALVHDALLLSRNLSDFQKVPGLRVETWLAQEGAQGV